MLKERDGGLMAGTRAAVADKKDAFELQHLHLLGCLETTTVSHSQPSPSLILICINKLNYNNNNNSRDSVYVAAIVAVHCHCESSPSSSDECSTQRQVAADLWTKPISLSQ